MLWNRIRHSGIASIILIMCVLGTVAAATLYTVSINQQITVANPFTVTITSNTLGVTCSTGTTISCSTGTLGIGSSEILNATVTFNTATQTSFTASSSNTSVATISPVLGTIVSPTRIQLFTVNALTAGSTTITLTFS